MFRANLTFLSRAGGQSSPSLSPFSGYAPLNSQENTCVGVSFFDKVADLRHVDLLE